MKFIPLFNKTAAYFAGSAFVLNLIFLYLNYGSTYYDGYRLIQGDIAYNILEHGTIKANAHRYDYLEKKWKERGQVPEIYEAHGVDCGEVTSYPSNDIHIGYSLVMALVWLCTKSYRYLDIALLQIILFCLAVFFFYSIAYLLFGSTTIAAYCCGALLLFFPIIFLNVNILRDIWPFYGIIAVLYATLAYLNDRCTIATVCGAGIVFALCQMIRPPSYLTLLTLSVVLGGYACVMFVQNKRTLAQKIATLVGCLWISNVLFFWIPFCAFNKYAYDRYFVGPVGQNLLEGLGEFSNRWGYKLEDYWYGTYMKQRYGLFIGTQEADDQAKVLFWEAFKEDPLHYVKCILRRIHRIILPALSWYPWLYNDKIYDHIEDLKSRISYLVSHFSSPRVFLDFLLRHFYVRLYLLVGYVGMILLLMRRYFFSVALLYGGIIVSSYAVIFSHVEHRYLIPAFGVFPFFVGYAVYEIVHWCAARKVRV